MNNLLTITGVDDSTSRTTHLLNSINADMESFDRSQLFEEREIAITTLLQIGDESENLHRHIRGNHLRKSATFTEEDCDFIREFHSFLCGKLLPFQVYGELSDWIFMRSYFLFEQGESSRLQPLLKEWFFNEAQTKKNEYKFSSTQFSIHFQEAFYEKHWSAAKSMYFAALQLYFFYLK